MKKTSYPGVWSLAKGRYLIVVHWTSEKDGKAKKKEATIDAKSAKDAARQREELRAECLSARPLAPRRTLAAAATSWFAMKQPSWKPSTRKQNASCIDAHVRNSVIGSYYVHAITADDVAAWRDSQTRSSKSRKEGPVTPTTINSRLRLLKEILKDVGADPRTLLVPSVREPLSEQDVRYLDAVEVGAVLEWLRLSEQWRQWHPLVATLALTGLRFGEATALRWSDLDEEGGWIRVRRAQVRGCVDHPKSKCGLRDVPLAPELAAILREHRTARMKQQRYAESPYVFVGRGCTLHHNSALNKPVRKALQALKIDGRFPTAKGFRKSHNNLLRQLRVGELVRQTLIGHASAEVGAKHYSRVSEHELREASAAVVRLVTGAK